MDYKVGSSSIRGRHSSVMLNKHSRKSSADVLVSAGKANTRTDNKCVSVLNITPVVETSLRHSVDRANGPAGV